MLGLRVRVVTRDAAEPLVVYEMAAGQRAFARKTGFTWHVDIHVEVDPAMTVAASHEIAGAVRRRVRSEVRWVADVLVHVEPAG